jgi:methylmalonyl-CoA mutase C-terminal domain/subunit
MFVANRKIRVLVPKLVAEAYESESGEIDGCLRDAGMDVIYMGLGETAETIAATAVREDVDVIELSLQGGAHHSLCQRIVSLVRAKSLNDCLVVVCDTAPAENMQTLNEEGVSRVFPSGISPSAIVEYVQTNVRPPWALQ